MRRRSYWWLARSRGRGIRCMWPMWWHCAAARWRVVPGWRWGARCWGFVVLNGLIIPIEELRMAEEFGDAYRRYCQQVRRWL